MNKHQTTFIRQWRLHRGYSIAQLAERVPVDKGNLSKIERGLLPYNQSSIERLADGLMTDISSLLTSGPSNSPSIQERIKQRLNENPNFTMRSASIAAGFSDSMLHKFLTGQTRSMNVDHLEALDAALGVNSRWLIFGDAPKLAEEKLVSIWDRNPEVNRPQALRVLETFADDGSMPSD